MQLTRFDRWLRRRFVYETQVQTLRRPESIPGGVRMRELPEVPGKRFRFHFTIRNDKLAEAFVHQLKEENLMFSTTVTDRQGWHVKWVAPANNRSVFWTAVWAVIGGMGCLVVAWYVHSLAINPEVMQMIRDAYDSVTG